jgi:DNA-binding CsgD family transcriptional regulator
LTGAEIAERLVVSPETVRMHVRNARARFGARTRAQLIAIAVRAEEIDFLSVSSIYPKRVIVL